MTSTSSDAPPGVTVITMANGKFGATLLNWMHHMHRMPNAPPAVVHALDDAGMINCTQFVAHHPRAAMSCVRAECCTPADGNGRPSGLASKAMMEAIAWYKFRAVKEHLQEHGKPVIFLDADALVLSPSCFDEWTAYPEDIVLQWMGTLTCPAHTFRYLGFALTTGAMLFRPASLPYVEHLLHLRNASRRTGGYRYRTSACYDQEVFNVELLGRMKWRDMWSVLEARTPPVPPWRPKPDRPLSLRVLDLARWPFVFPVNMSMYIDMRLGYFNDAPPKESYDANRTYKLFLGPLAPDTCLAHAAGGAWAGGRWSKDDELKRRGLWYLPP